MTTMSKPTDDELLGDLLAWADEVEVEDLEVEDTSDLAAVGAAQTAVLAQLQALDLAVAAARGAGRSWTEIGQRVGMSRQAARQRWAKTVEVGSYKTPDGQLLVLLPKPSTTRHRGAGKSTTSKSAAAKTSINTSGTRTRRAAAALAPAAKTTTRHKG